MERAGSDFKRHDGLWIYSSNLNSPEFEPKGKWVCIGFFVEQDLSKQKLFKRIETLTTLPIKEVDQRATAVNLVELYQFCQGRSKFKS
jgi:hypothetical protein